MQFSVIRAALALAALLPLAAHAQDPEVSIELTGGASITGAVVTNAQSQKVNAFRGIRYAEAPTGQNRFKPSKLLKPSGAIKATTFGDVCLTNSGPSLFTQSEDCLFLNVYAPASATAGSKLPVMVWTHGGGWISGNGNIYDGRNLVGAAGNDVIYVSFNYRLGVFGFLANQQLLKEGNGANAGLGDVTNAYQWVRDNIAQFGGNPKDITAFGEDAGAFMIALQMITDNGNQKIFDKAILGSGGYPTFSQLQSTAEQDKLVGDLATAVGCTEPESAKVLECLRTKDATALTNASSSMPWRPVVDGKFLTDMPQALVASGKVSKIPTVSGTTTHEGYMSVMSVTSDEVVVPAINASFPMLTSDELAAIPTLYPSSAFATPTLRASEIFGDLIYVCPSEQLTEALAPSVKSTYRYRFNQADATLGVELALHSADLKYVFNTAELPAGEDGQALSANIQKFWTNFARYGSPSGSSDAATWPAYDSAAKEQIVLQKTLVIEKNGAYMPMHAERCAFWNKVEGRVAATSLYKRAEDRPSC